MITSVHCMPYIGQHVGFRTRDGLLHHGILHSVTGDGIYVRPVGGPTTRLMSETNVHSTDFHLLQNLPQPNDDLKDAFFPFFFFPFLALVAIGPWGRWWW